MPDLGRLRIRLDFHAALWLTVLVLLLPVGRYLASHASSATLDGQQRASSEGTSSVVLSALPSFKQGGDRLSPDTLLIALRPMVDVLPAARSSSGSSMPIRSWLDVLIRTRAPPSPKP